MKRKNYQIKDTVAGDTISSCTPGGSSGAFDRDCVARGAASGRNHRRPSGSCPGAPTELSLLDLQKVACLSFFRKANRPQKENKIFARLNEGASWGRMAWVRRTVGDCGASSDWPNGSIMPEAVRQEGVWRWNVKYCRNVVCFHKHHHVPP